MSRPGAVQCASASRVGPVFWYSTESFIDLFRAAFRYCVSRLHSGLFTPLSFYRYAGTDFVIRGGAARRGGGSMNRPLPRGSSSRPMVARLFRYGPVRQKKTDFHLWKPICFAIYRPDEGRRS